MIYTSWTSTPPMRGYSTMSSSRSVRYSPFSFPSARTARAYLSGRNIVPEYAVYDDTWGP